MQFQAVDLLISQPGQRIVYCAIDDPRATCFYVNDKGEKYSATRPIENIFAVELRSQTEMTGACRKLLHSETWSQPLKTKPVIPDNALFIARTFERSARR